MEDVSKTQLRRVIEVQHGVASTFSKSVRVHKASGQQPGWDGVVHIFELINHPSASQAFAWSSDIVGGRQPRFFAVLKSRQIATPLQAVRAAASAILKWGAQGIRG